MIPGTVKAQVSVRIVPDQDLQTIAKALCDHLKSTFQALLSPNKLQVRCSINRFRQNVHMKQVCIEHTADWWLGKLDDPWFRALEQAVRDEWSVEPLRIREGGVCLSRSLTMVC